MAKALSDKPKHVYSSALTETTWNNSSIVNGINEQSLNRFKESDQKGLLTIGSPGLVAALTDVGLVDDYYFCLQPLIAGGGEVRLFDKIRLSTRQPLKFVRAVPLKTGVLIVHYQQT